MVAPLLGAAGQLLLGTAITGGAAWAGSALMPTLQKAMGNGVNWKLNDDPADWGENHERRVIQTDKQGNTTYRPLDETTVRAFGGWETLRARNQAHSLRLDRLRKEQELRGIAQQGQKRADLMARIEAGKLSLARENAQAERLLGLRRAEVEEADSIRRNETNRQQLTDNREQNRSLNQIASERLADDRVTNANQARQTAYQNEVAAATAEHQASVEAWRWNQENASRPGQLLMLAGSRLMGGAS